MKTIEERAKEAGIVSQYKSDYRYDTRSVESGYMQGATEQKAIDIENACKACESELRRLEQLLYESVGIPANLISVDKSLSRIRLEMLSSTK